MFTESQLNLIQQSLSANKKNVKSDVYLKPIDEILQIIDKSKKSLISPNISDEEFAMINEAMEFIEDRIKIYVEFDASSDLETLETIKREITGQMSYLTNFRDKFVYEVEFLEEVFKKERCSLRTIEISKMSGVSINQAEKQVGSDSIIVQNRRDLYYWKSKIGVFKTKYDYFNRVIQSIIQSISVVGKERHNSKMS